MHNGIKTMLNKSILERYYLGKEIEIINMDGEPKYKGKKGVVTLIDDDLQLHGTWGGCALIYGLDDFEMLEKEKHGRSR